MKVHELLVERVLNMFAADSKEKYADEVWEILRRSYTKLGGFKSAANVDELIKDTGLWKIITRDGKISALGIYKDKFGRKSIASGTDGTKQGLKDYLMIKAEDIGKKRAWAEVSGPAERMMQKSGAQPIPAKFAEVLTGKEILEFNDDGVHYTRLIAGHPHEKIIYGFVNVDDELRERMIAIDIDVQNLPSNFSVK